MKKMLLILNIFLFGLILSGFLPNTDAKLNESVLKPMQIFEAGSRKEDNNLSIQLKFKGEILPFDEATQTFYLPLSIKTVQWECGDFTTDMEEVTILFLEDISKINKFNAIKTNQSYEFAACTEKEFKLYKVVFTGMPILNIEITDQMIEDKAVVNIKLYDSEKKINWITKSTATLKVRGATSRNFPKLSFKLDLIKKNNLGNTVKNDLALLGMRKDNDWILNAMYSDDSKIRDKLSIDIWNAFGASDNRFDADFGTKLEYVELFINDEYYGIYGLMEPVDAKMLKVEQAENKNVQEYIYKRSVNNGLSLDDFSENSDTIVRCGFELDGVSKYGEINLDTWNPLMNFIKVHNEEDEEIYRQEISEVIDINSAINNWLFLQIVSGFDNQKKNMYYVSKITSEGIKLFFVPWDLDLTWGNVYQEESQIFSSFDPSVLTKGVNWETGQRLIDTNAQNSIALLDEKWKILRGSILTDKALLDHIDELEAQLINSGAMERETNRWSDGGHSTDYSIIESYAVRRMQYLDEYITSLSIQSK